MRSVRGLVLCGMLGLTACGSDDSAPAPASTLTEAQAARLLDQTSFGATDADLARATGMTAAQWVDEQLARPPTLHLPRYLALYNGDHGDRNARLNAWMEAALLAPDQLRQRVAFALSEIMVVSELGGGLNNANQGLANYYDLLLRNAFGNYRTLIEEVTLSPVMGRYLSMLGNQKPNPATGLRADENYAREVMQLFSLGLVQLNADGSARLDGAGQPLPTYTQTDIENLARVFTGWWFAGARRFGRFEPNWLDPMQPFEEFHDPGAKTLVGGVAVPAGGTARQDLAIAMDTLFNHASVGPFIARQLIQKLVTSNPSPAYVARASAVFANNGAGVRGDLGALARAILLDLEARADPQPGGRGGKVREPLLALTHLWRAFGAAPGSAGYAYNRGGPDFGQSPLGAPSVFNFFSPGYAPAGEIADAGLVAPEFQLLNESSATNSANRLFQAIYRDYLGGAQSPADAVKIDLAPLRALAHDPAALVARIARVLGTGGAAFDRALIAHLEATPNSDGGLARAQDALYLAITSAQYQVQR